MSELGCADAGASRDLLALGKSKVELAERVALFLPSRESCREIKDCWWHGRTLGVQNPLRVQAWLISSQQFLLQLGLSSWVVLPRADTV